MFAKLSKSNEKRTVLNDNLNWTSTNERLLHNSLLIEQVRNYGVKVNYIHREYHNKNQMFGEDYSNTFKGTKQVAMYIENQENNNNAMFSNFGYRLEDEADLVVPIDLFREFIGTDEPSEGDLLYVPTTSDLWEIKKVNVIDSQFQWGGLPIRRLQCRRFVHSGEVIEAEIKVNDNEMELIDQLKNLNIEYDREETTEYHANEDFQFDVNDPFGFNDKNL